MCNRYYCYNCYYYGRVVHISVAVDMRTLLDRKSFSSSSNGQVAAHRVTRLIIKRLWLNSSAPFVHFVVVRVVRFSGDAAREGAEYPNTGLSPLWHRQRLHRSVPSARWAGRGGGREDSLGWGRQCVAMSRPPVTCVD